ncbi:uncharacterized protein C2845_PM05G33400 [Panicum miliaceum]|uniref:Uncharacterized protein n=1 Tax=Panicum miliaceum TaxID=4540 RepID=A0A3L6T0M2_PANMI|nr:uncharacterized protein C2845_PM05G33400 [Panicum miliaceum]
MASAKENVPLAPQPLPRQTSNARPPPRPWPKVANGATEPAAGGGVLKCTCFRLPSRSKKKPPPPPLPPAVKLSSASRGSAVAPDDVPAAASRSLSQRVTFRASASLATWWPASPSAPASAGAGGSVAPRRASTSSAPPRNAGAGAPRASSSSFSHWRRSLSPRVMPHGGRASFSFPASPASASSSCMSTPKIPQGCQQQG